MTDRKALWPSSLFSSAGLMMTTRVCRFVEGFSSGNCLPLFVFCGQEHGKKLVEDCLASSHSSNRGISRLPSLNDFFSNFALAFRPCIYLINLFVLAQLSADDLSIIYIHVITNNIWSPPLNALTSLVDLIFATSLPWPFLSPKIYIPSALRAISYHQ